MDVCLVGQLQQRITVSIQESEPPTINVKIKVVENIVLEITVLQITVFKITSIVLE